MTQTLKVGKQLMVALSPDPILFLFGSKLSRFFYNVTLPEDSLPHVDLYVRFYTKECSFNPVHV